MLQEERCCIFLHDNLAFHCMTLTKPLIEPLINCFRDDSLSDKSMSKVKSNTYGMKEGCLEESEATD